MGTVGTIILIVIVFFIGKFIYDSYITDNTEKNWKKFKRQDPIGAGKIENNNFGKKSINNEKLKSELDLVRFDLVKKEMKSQTEEYMNKKIHEFKNSGEIQISSPMYPVLVMELLEELNQEFKDEFMRNNNKIGLGKVDIYKEVDNATRNVIKQNLKIDLG